MYFLLQKLDQPLFYIDRRWIFNRHKRERWNAIARTFPDVGALMDKQDDEVRQAGMQAIGFLKLSAIVSAGVTPLFVVFFFISSAIQHANFSDYRESIIKDLDQRYVSKPLDDVKMADYGARIGEAIALNHQQEEKIAMLENKVRELEKEIERLQSEKGGRR